MSTTPNLCGDTSGWPFEVTAFCATIDCCGICKLGASCTDHFFGYSTEACVGTISLTGGIADFSCSYTPTAEGIGIILAICFVCVVVVSIGGYIWRMFSQPSVVYVQTTSPQLHQPNLSLTSQPQIHGSYVVRS